MSGAAATLKKKNRIIFATEVAVDEPSAASTCSASAFPLSAISFEIALMIFFFQAEDCMRDYKVTGVQTCALPIYRTRVVDVHAQPVGQAGSISSGAGTGVGEIPRGREDAGGTGRHTDSPVQTRRTERRHRQQLPQATTSAGCSCLYRGSPREGQDVQWVNGWFEFERDKSVYVNHYYFYIDDEDFGPLFIKICSYAPWSMKLCLNGHEWAKRQLEKKKTAYEALDNGFLSCAEPEKLRQICDSLGPEDIDRVFRKWLRRIPLPLRPQ